MYVLFLLKVIEVCYQCVVASRVVYICSIFATVGNLSLTEQLGKS